MAEKNASTQTDKQTHTHFRNYISRDNDTHFHYHLEPLNDKSSYRYIYLGINTNSRVMRLNNNGKFIPFLERERN